MQLDRTSVVARPAFEEETNENENNENEIENNETIKNQNFVCVQFDQLKLLHRHCYVCGNRIFDETIKYKTKGGTLFVKYWCGKCSAYRYWKSYESSLSVIAAGAANLAGIGFSKIIDFFLFFSCVFPSKFGLFQMSKNVIYPVIRTYYEHIRKQIINQLVTKGPLDICVDGQYDSPGFCAYFCTVNAMEATTGKLIGFATVRRSEVNNRSPNCEPEATRRLFHGK